MASIRKVKNRWLAEVRLKRFSASKTFATRLEAQSWAIEQEQQHGKHGGLVSGKTLGVAFQKYADEVSPSKKGARWEKIRLKKLQRDSISDILLINLRREDLQDWINRRSKEVSAGSVSREIKIISSVLRECRVNWKYMADYPLADVKRPKNPPPRWRRISEEEIKLVLLALEYVEEGAIKTSRQQIAVAFLLAIETAMRHGELWSLTWDNVHLSGKKNTSHHAASRLVPAPLQR